MTNKEVTLLNQGKLLNKFEGLNPADLIEEEKDSVVALALAVIQEKHKPGIALKDVKQARDFFRLKLSELPNEVFAVLYLNNKHRILAYEELFQGTIDGAAIYPRVIAQRSLTLNSASIIIAHNHPSGDPEPSECDNKITQKITKSLKLLEIRVLDHIIVGTEGTVSMAERGLL